MPDVARFVVFMAAAFLFFVALLQSITAMGFVVVVFGMLFARYHMLKRWNPLPGPRRKPIRQTRPRQVRLATREPLKRTSVSPSRSRPWRLNALFLVRMTFRFIRSRAGNSSVQS
jgi:hypothetical protein